MSATATFIIPVTPTAAAQPSVTNTATVSGGGDPACPGRAPLQQLGRPDTGQRPAADDHQDRERKSVDGRRGSELHPERAEHRHRGDNAASTISDTIPAGLTIGALPGGCCGSRPRS